MRCPALAQDNIVWDDLCNYCATTTTTSRWSPRKWLLAVFGVGVADLAGITEDRAPVQIAPTEVDF
jgi:hypothetical protein